MNHDEIAQVWIRNGGNPARSDVAAAVALAESGGDPNSVNDDPGTGDYSIGLWQINFYGNLRIPRTLAYGTPDAVKDPDRNAAAAISISGNGANWTPWTTYTHGAYRKFLTGSNTPSADVSGAQLISTSSAAGAAPGHSGLTLSGMLTNSDQLAQAGVRLGEILAGGLLVGMGLVLIAYTLLGTPVRKAVTATQPALRAGQRIQTRFQGARAARSDAALDQEIDEGEQAAPEPRAQRQRYRQRVVRTAEDF